MFKVEDMANSGQEWRSPAFDLLDSAHPAATGRHHPGAVQGAGHGNKNTSAIAGARGEIPQSTGRSGTSNSPTSGYQAPTSGYQAPTSAYPQTAAGIDNAQTARTAGSDPNAQSMQYGNSTTAGYSTTQGTIPASNYSAHEAPQSLGYAHQSNASSLSGTQGAGRLAQAENEAMNSGTGGRHV